MVVANDDAELVVVVVVVVVVAAVVMVEVVEVVPAAAPFAEGDEEEEEARGESGEGADDDSVPSEAPGHLAGLLRASRLAMAADARDWMCWLSDCRSTAAVSKAPAAARRSVAMTSRGVASRLVKMHTWLRTHWQRWRKALFVSEENAQELASCRRPVRRKASARAGLADARFHMMLASACDESGESGASDFTEKEEE